MTARRGLDGQAVIDAAREVVAKDGADALTLSSVARHLGVKPPSLYNHVSNLETLRRDVALSAVVEAADAVRSATMGRSGEDALRAMAGALRAYAVEHPALYAISAEARPDDEEFVSASFAAVEPFLVVMEGYGIHGDDAIHAARTFRSAVHGFASLEIGGGFGIDVDLDESFAWLVDRYILTLAQ